MTSLHYAVIPFVTISWQIAAAVGLWGHHLARQALTMLFSLGDLVGLHITAEGLHTVGCLAAAFITKQES